VDGQGAGACCCAGAAVIPAGAGCEAATGFAAGLAAGLPEVVFLAAGFLVGFCANGGAGLSSTITGLGRNDVELPAAKSESIAVEIGSIFSDSGR